MKHTHVTASLAPLAARTASLFLSVTAAVFVMQATGCGKSAQHSDLREFAKTKVRGTVTQPRLAKTIAALAKAARNFRVPLLRN